MYNYKRYYSQETGAYISQDPIGLAGNNPTLYGYVHDPNSWIDVFGLKSNSVELARNLTKKPQGNYAAHHIVMTGTNDTQMNSLIAQMNTHGININGAENGIWLPKRDCDKVQGQAQTSHQQDGLHGKAYKQELFDRLNGKNKQDFLAELSKIKEELNKGRTWETQTTKKLKKCIR